MIGIGLILYLLLTRRTRKTWERVFAYLMLGILVVPYILLVTSFGSYLLSRMNELFVYNKDASSGYVRFRSWIFVVEKAWNKNFLLGSGIGTGADYVSEFAIQFYAMTLNGFARVATELGLSGLGLWMGNGTGYSNDGPYMAYVGDDWTFTVNGSRPLDPNDSSVELYMNQAAVDAGDIIVLSYGETIEVWEY